MLDHLSPRSRWEVVEELFQKVLTLPTAERPAYLAQASVDADLRNEVAALVAAHAGRGPFDDLMDGVRAPVLPPNDSLRRVPPDAPPLPRYRILDCLGGGGMGIVYRARDERLERDVALKFLPPHLSSDQAAKKRFLIEARAAAALEHPNICTVHEIGDTDDGQLYIVMACYDGETLDRRIALGPLPIDDALRIAREIALGLAKAHERGIVHRDIKPSNIIITNDGLVKILDFGIAKLATSTVPQIATVVGTLAYMSPEQAFGEAVDHRSDIWSLGVVLYEMLTGVRPFRGASEHGALFNALADEPDPVSVFRGDVPDSIDALLRRALAKRPEGRFASTTELLAALAACQRDLRHAPNGLARTSGPVIAASTMPDTALTRGGERRQVTMVTCAIDEYATLVERLPPETVESILRQIRNAATEIATRNGGIVNQFVGDAFVMLFGLPTAHEDDALRGIRSTLALHASMADIGATLPEPSPRLHLRSGVHVGAVVARRLREGDQRFRITGPAADIAARLAAVAEPDAILLSPEMRRLVDPFVRTIDAGAVTLQPGAAPVAPLRVLGASEARSRLEAASAAGLTPFVGRERERATLGAQLDAAIGGQGRLTTIIGEAGAGKSRLLHELRQTAAERGMSVLVGRCEAHGSSTPFLPFVDAAQQSLNLPLPSRTPRERHDAVIAAARAIHPSLEEFIPFYLALFAIASETHPVPAHLRDELFQSAMLEAIAALFTVGSRARPTVLMLEDWHWADEGSRAALRQLTEILSEFPLSVVVTARPLATLDWGMSEHQTHIALAPLDIDASTAIASAAFGAEHVASELVAQLHERTGGNPFFLEEVCAALREEGVVVMHDGAAALAHGGESFHVPETIQIVLRTRIDRLDGEARDLLRVASVIGREFTRGILEDVSESSSDLARALDRLKRSGLVMQTSVLPEPSYRFKHALTQEVAYDSLLEHQRAALHAAVGRAIERRYAQHLEEHADRLAFHFSRAAAWGEAVRYGIAAADRALALSQNADALTTTERVEEWLLRLPDDDGRRDLHAEVLLRQERLCETLGLRNRQLGLMETLIALLAPHGASAKLSQAYLRQGDAFTLLRRFESAERALETALGIARERSDAAGERNALRSIALLRSYEGRHEEALETIERVLALGRAAGDTRAEAGDLATMANVLRAMGQPERALLVLQAALEQTKPTNNPVRYGALLNVIGGVHRELGDYDTALHYFRRVSLEGVEQRHPVNASFTLPAIAQILLQQGHVEQALATFQQAVEINRKARYADGSAHACRSLGEALVALGRDEEALPHLRDAATLFAQLEDRENESLMWRRVAIIHEHASRSVEMLDAWTRVRALTRQTGNLAGEAVAVEGMARAEQRLDGRSEAVIGRYEEVLALATRAGDRKRELAARNSLGIAHWRRGGYVEALRQYELALRLCRSTNDRVHEGLILNSLGATLHKLRRWNEARTTLSEAVRVSEAAGERSLVGHALAALGDVCMASGRLDDALQHFESSLAIRRELGDEPGQERLQERIARVHDARVRSPISLTTHST